MEAMRRYLIKADGAPGLDTDWQTAIAKGTV